MGDKDGRWGTGRHFARARAHGARKNMAGDSAVSGGRLWRQNTSSPHRLRIAAARLPYLLPAPAYLAAPLLLPCLPAFLLL